MSKRCSFDLLLRVVLPLLSASVAEAGVAFHSVVHSVPSTGFGTAVAGGGDIDADGVTDFFIGEPGGTHGHAYARSGRTGELLLSFQGGPGFGASVACDGDVDGDGHADLAVTGDGQVHVYSGATGAAIHVVIFFGDAASQVLFLGDMNYDGRDEFLVADPHRTIAGKLEVGRVTLFSGATGASIREWTGLAAHERFGYSIAAAGDMNHDGDPDFLVATEHHVWGAGASVEIFSPYSTIPIGSLDGSLDIDYARSIAGGMDIDLDGTNDVVVGCPGSSISGHDVGAVYVYSGATHQLIQYAWGSQEYAMLGSQVAVIEDINGDHRPDVVVSSPGASGGWIVPWHGEVSVLGGLTGEVLVAHHGIGAAYHSFGRAVAVVGDLDGDGDEELVVGDPHHDGVLPFVGAVFVLSNTSKVALAESYGSGLAGQFGTPTLTVDHGPILCEPFSMGLSNSRLFMPTPAFLFAGVQSAVMGTEFTGVLLVQPALVLPFMVPALGLSVSLEICDASLVGVDLFLQAVEVDPAAQKGYSFSAGLHLRTGL